MKTKLTAIEEPSESSRKKLVTSRIQMHAHVETRGFEIACFYAYLDGLVSHIFALPNAFGKKGGS